MFVLACVVLHAAAVFLNIGDVNVTDPDDPVMAPLGAVVLLPVMLALVAGGVALRRRRDG